MRKTLYLKFILAYILFAFFGFITVATFVSRLTYEYCQRQTSRDMYREASRIADTYAVDLYNHTVTGDVTMTLCCERADPHHMPCVVIVNEDLD